MKILLFGNIASGKTELAYILQSELKIQHYLAIDKCRTEFSDGSMKGELIAQKKFFEDLNRYQDNLIVECLGIGAIGKKIMRHFEINNDELICLFLDVPLEICISRLNARQKSIPFPCKFDDILTTINKFDNIFKSKILQQYWTDRPNTKVYSKRNITEVDRVEIIATLKKGILSH